jgi:hypothetical protein
MELLSFILNKFGQTEFEARCSDSILLSEIQVSL